MDIAAEPLARLRERVHDSLSEEEHRELVAALEQDPRRGARELAARMLRRRRAAVAEGERMRRLFERRAKLFADGARLVAGVDEVGMGPLAGPVVAVAVILPEHVDLDGLKDSKQLSARAREDLEERIRAQALACSAGKVPPADIDRLNIRQAGLEAMRRAVAGLELTPDHVLVDANTIPGIAIPQTPIIGGDASDGSIAAASIVAKVHRDAIMRHLESRYPGYGFDRHMGYGTEQHLAALRRLGPSPVHRRSFAPVANVARR